MAPSKAITMECEKTFDRSTKRDLSPYRGHSMVTFRPPLLTIKGVEDKSSVSFTDQTVPAKGTFNRDTPAKKDCP